MDSLRQLRELSSRTAPGITPEFLPAHIWKTIELVYSEKIGRKSLAEALDLGEGTVRNIIRRLVEGGLLETSRTGMSLTSDGERLYRGLERHLTGTELCRSNITVASKNYAVLVKAGEEYVERGIEQRDKALIAGARGATTITYLEDGFNIPGMEMEVDPEMKQCLEERLHPEEGDAIVIGSANKMINAYIGAISAALDIYYRDN
ncbi:MAG: DUF4443 domain-containing protein [Candidatus Bathyarchaeia archaeon]